MATVKKPSEYYLNQPNQSSITSVRHVDIIYFLYEEVHFTIVVFFPIIPNSHLVNTNIMEKEKLKNILQNI